VDLEIAETAAATKQDKTQQGSRKLPFDEVIECGNYLEDEKMISETSSRSWSVDGRENTVETLNWEETREKSATCGSVGDEGEGTC
jgi:hypothetical protein